jgi:two-component system, cell cycle sensor histidine kinase and response regulator CckA
MPENPDREARDIAFPKGEDGWRFAKFSMDRAADAIYWIDPQARILDVNEAASLMLGYSKDELCAMTVHDLNPDFQAGMWPGFWAETKRRQTMSIETTHRAKNGRVIPVEVTVNFLLYEGKEYHCAFVRNITERKQREAALVNSQQLLQASEARYRALFESNPHMYFILDSAGTIISVNRQGALQLGYRVEELLGQPVTLLFPEKSHEAVRAQVTVCFNNAGRANEWEIVKNCKDGTLIWVHETAVVIQDEKDQPFLLVLCNDITERKRTESELLDTRQFLDSIVEHVPNMLFVKDAKELRFVRFNKAGEELLGYPAADLIGKNDYDFFPKEQAVFFTAKDRETLASGRILDIPEESIQTKHMGERILHTKKIPILDTTGKPQFLLGISEDITEQKRAEQERWKLSKFTIERASEAIFWIDSMARILDVNQAACALLGYTKEEICSLTIPDIAPNFTGDAWAAHWVELKQRGSFMLQTTNRTKDGRLLPAEINVNYLNFEGSEYICAFVKDISARKQLEAALSKTQAQLAQAQKMEAIGRLAGGVAHDFNNLLTVINGYGAQLLDQLPPADHRREMVEATLESGERAAELTKQLLAFSRQQVLKLQPISLNDSLQALNPLLSRLLGDDITVTMDLASDLWTVHCDKGQMDQVTMNLAINARDAMPKGGELSIATLNIELTTEAPDHRQIMPHGQYVQLSIGDTGHGMSSETLANIFEPFFTTKPEGQGTGLGLATVYGIVKQSNGYIFVESAPDQGATFQLYFPRLIASAVEDKSQTAFPKAGSETVLVVEDQDLVRTYVVQALKHYGYKVIEATNGENALQTAATLSEPVHVLLTDIVMPKMSGPDLAERLRMGCPRLRVLYMSGYTNDSHASFLESPGSAFIQKPFKPDKLASELRELLETPI